MQGHGWIHLNSNGFISWLGVLVINTAVFGLYAAGVRVGWELASNLF